MLKSFDTAKHLSTGGQFLKNQIAKVSSVGNSYGLLLQKFVGYPSDWYRFYWLLF